MNKIEFDIIYDMMQSLWPNWKAADAEYALFWSWFKEHDLDTIRGIIQAVAGENEYKPPRKAIRAKLNTLPRPKNKSDYHFVDTYFVCTETDGTCGDIYPGRLIEIAYQDRYTPDEILRFMRNEVAEVFQEKYNWGICRFEYYVGIENYPKARARAEEIKKEKIA